jgi:hypothetical protein
LAIDSTNRLPVSARCHPCRPKISPKNYERLRAKCVPSWAGGAHNMMWRRLSCPHWASLDRMSVRAALQDRQAADACSVRVG